MQKEQGFNALSNTFRRLMSKYNFSRKYFNRLLYLGLFTVCIPLLLSLLLLYFLISNNMEQQINASTQKTLSQVQQRIDERLLETEQAMVSLMFDIQVADAIYKSNISPDNIALLTLYEKLNLVKQAVPRAYSVDLYLLQQKTLLSSAHGYLSGNNIKKMHEFYDSYVPGNTPLWRYSTFSERLNGGNEDIYITYTNQLPFFSKITIAYVSVLFKANDLFQIVNSTEDATNIATMVMHTNGDILYHSKKSYLTTIQWRNCGITY